MKNRFSLIALLVSLILGWQACEKKDFDYRPEPPKVIFDGNVNSRSATPGATIRIRYTIQAASEAASLRILQSVNGASATQVSEITQFADPLQLSSVLAYTVPANTSAGNTVRVIFELTDKRGAKNDTAIYTVNVVGAQYTQATQILCGQEVIALGPPPNTTTTIINLNDFTFETGKRYLIRGLTTFEEGNRVIFEPGTIIYGLATPLSQQGASVLVIPAGTTVQMNGTKENPVVFTSSNSLCGGALPGDWQGLDIRGQHHLNPSFNSGSIRYIRVEYGGRDFVDNQTTGSLRLSNLSNPTVVEYIQSWKSFGNAIRINGGNVNIRYAISVDQVDNGFRCDDFQLPSGASVPGWTGNGQFWISLNNFTKEPPELEIRDGCNARFSNITLIGRGMNAGGAEDAIRIRNTAGGYRIFNMVVAQIPDDGVRGELPNPSANLSGDRVIGHSILFDIKDQIFRDQVGVFNQAVYNNTFTAVAGIGTNNFVPGASPASSFDPTTLGTWFLPASFAGAVANAAGDWTADGSWCRNADGSIR